MPLTETQLKTRDAQRDLGAELLQAARGLKAGKGKVVAQFELPPSSNFVAARGDHVAGKKPVLNRAVGLKDSWGK
jgi:hypothetical protein